RFRRFCREQYRLGRLGIQERPGDRRPRHHRPLQCRQDRCGWAVKSGDIRTARWACRPAAGRSAALCRIVTGACRQACIMTHEDIEATKAPLMEHLIELRSRLIKAVIAFALMFVLCFFFAKLIYNVLVWPFVWVAGPVN